MEVLYTFHDLHEIVKYREFHERSYVEEFHANCSICKTRKRLSLGKKFEISEYYATHKNYKETAAVLIFMMQLLRKYWNINIQHHPKRPTKGNSVVSKEVRISKETREHESLYFIRQKLINKF